MNSTLMGVYWRMAWGVLFLFLFLFFLFSISPFLFSPMSNKHV
jgi:hypothetical protein